MKSRKTSDSEPSFFEVNTSLTLLSAFALHAATNVCFSNIRSHNPKVQVCHAIRCEELEAKKKPCPELHLFKQPNIALTAKDYKAKELRMCFSTPSITLSPAASHIWVGDLEMQKEKVPVYVAPYLNFAEGAEFI